MLNLGGSGVASLELLAHDLHKTCTWYWPALWQNQLGERISIPTYNVAMRCHLKSSQPHLLDLFWSKICPGLKYVLPLCPDKERKTQTMIVSQLQRNSDVHLNNISYPLGVSMHLFGLTS